MDSPTERDVRGAGRAAWARWLAPIALLLAVLVSTGGPAGARGTLRTPVAHGGETASPLPTRQVLRRTLRGDPSQEYLLYIPGTGGRGAPLFVTVHGISRNVEEHASLFAPFADRYGVILVAPYFSARGHDDYQRLGRVGRGPRADRALDNILQEVRALTGSPDAPFYLFGFSGGAQFAHRYALAHPDRVARAAVGSAGWYTFPDSETPYPYGLGASPELPDLRFDPAAFLRLPITVLVGEGDTLAGENLRQTPEADRQGSTRLERAERWAAAMRRMAEARGVESRVTLVEVPGVGHSFRQFMENGSLGERVFESMFGKTAAPQPAHAGGRP